LKSTANFADADAEFVEGVEALDHRTCSLRVAVGTVARVPFAQRPGGADPACAAVSAEPGSALGAGDVLTVRLG
jgi:hypothetical protein